MSGILSPKLGMEEVPGVIIDTMSLLCLGPGWGSMCSGVHSPPVPTLSGPRSQSPMGSIPVPLNFSYMLGLAKERRRLNTGRRKERRHRLIPHFPPGRCSTTARLLPGSLSLSPSCLQAPLCPCALGPGVVTAPTAVSPGAPLVLVGFPNVIPPVAVNKSNPISVSQVSFTSSCWDL